MLTEIDRDFYCSGNETIDKGLLEIGKYGCTNLKDFKLCESCSLYHRKYPTPEQFKEEYGEEWTGAVYVYFDMFGEIDDEWEVFENEDIATIDTNDTYIVCACTPFGKPPKNWRPE